MKTSLPFCTLAQRFTTFLTLLFLTSLTTVYSQTKFYVTVSGGASIKDGLSWTTAYGATQLQTAIDAASTYSQSHSDEDVQVWVASGAYKPTSGADRTISFLMRNHVALYGGFEGDETLLSERPAINLNTPSGAILSGEINAAGTADNSYHVIKNTGIPLTASAVLDGFVVTGGNANSLVEEGDIHGAGMINVGGSPTVSNCHFIMNKASQGGAMSNLSGSGGISSPVITNCAFLSNTATGGAIYNFAYFGTVSPVITNCSFMENSSSNGGAMYNGLSGGGSCVPVINNCSFTGNSSTSNSGVIANDGGSPKVTNCSFTDNSAERGGVSLNYTVQTFTNCSFSGNTSVQGGGVSYQTSGTTTFKNCSFWNNGGAQTFLNLNAATIIANYCLFEPTVAGYTGANNLTTSVLPFVSATDLQLTACSPAINAGDPGSTTVTSGTTDLAGNPRFYNGGIVDIGAFEFQGDQPSPPVISSAGESSLTVTQNASSVNFTITGCETGTLNWQGSNATSGSGTTIAVPTNAVGTIIYSATCTVGSCASQPGSATATITAAPVSGSFDGYIYGADCGSFRGWAWDRNKGNTVVSVDILDGASVIATIPAGDFRQDLLNAGKGNGKHAFTFAIPDALKDNLPHTLKARVTGSSFILKDSPKALICQNSAVPPGNLPPVPPTPTVLIAPLVAQENVPFSGTLVAFTDPEGGPLTYSLSGLPIGLTLDATSRVISGTPTQVGTFLLTYSATDGPGSTNSVSFNLTVLPAPSSAITGDFDGYLDKLDCGGIRGWVWDRNKPNTPFTVEFYTEPSPGSITVLGSTLANIYRSDLKDAGKGNGAHAYNFTAPPSLASSTPVKARVLGSGFVLKGSPKTYQCAQARLSAESAGDLQVTVLGNPVTDQIQVEIRGQEGQPLRLQVTDASGRLISEQQIEKAKAVEQPIVSVSKVAPGLLVLRVSTASASKTVKVLKSH
ncbi:putative Ig domain-containing protein [Larkinella terrae]|uniref:T9SS type A sorting domain-containing protein n=1 Tax=Larkinella terrae TaxID=2025311 RepID=A0A7K0EF85_9BACT|nr:putative Ig domain-containing protein [Larkinella terrae]MRS60477.1 T9SS type A sorting domain-containing protein [Larkinella terrae]